MICQQPITQGLRKGQPRTGTLYGYDSHRKVGEPPCRECLDGAAAARRAYRKNGRKKRDNLRNGTSVRMTVGEYESMVVAQCGACAICGAVSPGEKDLAVDHDHKTGKVRGLLCIPCNAGLGLLRDNPENLARAATYLEGQ